MSDKIYISEGPKWEMYEQLVKTRKAWKMAYTLWHREVVKSFDTMTEKSKQECRAAEDAADDARDRYVATKLEARKRFGREASDLIRAANLDAEAS